MPEPIAGPEPATLVTPFESPSELATAWRTLLPLAVTDILVFDRDLKEGDWNSPERNDVLRRFLLDSRRARLQIVVHDTRYIEQFLPRLVLVVRDFSHKFEILRTVDDGRNAWDGFTLVDRRHFVHRFHLDTMKGDCTEHALLAVSLMRAAGIPAKRIDGVIYQKGSDGVPALMWHEWVSAFVGEWVQLDPTWGQPVADATHFAVGEETGAEIAPLIGELQVTDVR